jgi:hypothetical protein
VARFCESRHNLAQWQYFVPVRTKQYVIVILTGQRPGHNRRIVPDLDSPEKKSTFKLSATGLSFRLRFSRSQVFVYITKVNLWLIANEGATKDSQTWRHGNIMIDIVVAWIPFISLGYEYKILLFGNVRIVAKISCLPLSLVFSRAGRVFKGTMRVYSCWLFFLWGVCW